MELNRTELIEYLVDQAQNPRHYGELPGADVSITGGNPFCGDEVTVHLKLDGDKISAIHFSGHGCTISQAATSILTDELLGKKIDEVEGLDHLYIRELVGDEPVEMRPRCATLGLETIKAGLVEHQTKKKSDPDTKG
jgi:nitrogen fixation protein NifU and related proteins